jgi:WD40 repeat protein
VGGGVTPDGHRAFSGSADATLRVWDLETGQCLAVFPWNYSLRCVAVTPRAPYIAAAGDSQGNVLFFGIENLERV